MVIELGVIARGTRSNYTREFDRCKGVETTFAYLRSRLATVCCDACGWITMTDLSNPFVATENVADSGDCSFSTNSSYEVCSKYSDWTIVSWPSPSSSSWSSPFWEISFTISAIFRDRKFKTISSSLPLMLISVRIFPISENEKRIKFHRLCTIGIPNWF